MDAREWKTRNGERHPFRNLHVPCSRSPFPGYKTMSELTPREIVNELDRYIIG
jgi:hypothetical protein